MKVSRISSRLAQNFTKSIGVLILLLNLAPAHATQPNPKVTPGKLCTPSDPNFGGYRYKENIPYCNRNIPHDEKLKIAAEYGNIPESEWPNYEFDHLIPLSVGGSDDITNLWPQPIVEAHLKDVIEMETFKGLENGTITQAEAIVKIRTWISQH